MERARKISDANAFNVAGNNLHRAITAKNPQTERFWRKVFGAYAHIIAKRGADDTTWHLMNTASGYADGMMCRRKKSKLCEQV
jgi:hypothetical protein